MKIKNVIEVESDILLAIVTRVCEQSVDGNIPELEDIGLEINEQLEVLQELASQLRILTHKGHGQLVIVKGQMEHGKI